MQNIQIQLKNSANENSYDINNQQQQDMILDQGQQDYQNPNIIATGQLLTDSNDNFLNQLLQPDYFESHRSSLQVTGDQNIEQDFRNQGHLPPHQLQDVIPQRDSQAYQMSNNTYMKTATDYHEQRKIFTQEQRQFTNLSQQGFYNNTVQDQNIQPKVHIHETEQDSSTAHITNQSIKTNINQFSYYSKSLQFVHCYCRIPLKNYENFEQVWSDIEESIKDFLKSKKAKILHSKQFTRQLRFYFVIAKQGFEQSQWSKQIYQLCKQYIDGQPQFLQFGRQTQKFLEKK